MRRSTVRIGDIVPGARPNSDNVVDLKVLDPRGTVGGRRGGCQSSRQRACGFRVAAVASHHDALIEDWKHDHAQRDHAQADDDDVSEDSSGGAGFYSERQMRCISKCLDPLITAKHAVEPPESATRTNSPSDDHQAGTCRRVALRTRIHVPARTR